MITQKTIALLSLKDGTLTVVDEFPLEIGRDFSCDLTLEGDTEAALLHARITRTDAGEFFVEDLESVTGVFVNGQPMPKTGPSPLKDGDELKIGSTRFTVDVRVSAPGSTVGDEVEFAGSSKKIRNVLLVGVAAIGLIGIGIGIASSGSEEEKSTSDLVSEARPSTVLVVSKIDGERNGNGSGWVYDAEEGLIVTNAHVVDGGQEFDIGVDGDPDLRKASVEGVAPCDDLAVLRVQDTEGLRTMPLGSQADISQGDRLLTLGYPGNGTTEDDLQVTDGVVSVVQTRADEAALSDPDFAVYPNVIQTDAAINGGNSGGPAITEDGKLAGVNTLASTVTQNQNFAIGVDRVKELLPTLTAGESYGWAGFGFAAIPQVELASAGLPDIGGGALLVTSIVPGTGSENEKIFEEDLVTAVNGVPVETRRQYCSAVRDVQSGDVVPVEVLDSLSGYADFYNLEVPFE